MIECKVLEVELFVPDKSYQYMHVYMFVFDAFKDELNIINHKKRERIFKNSYNCKPGGTPILPLTDFN